MHTDTQLKHIDLFSFSRHQGHSFINPLVHAAEPLNVAWTRKFDIASYPRMWARMARTRPAVFAANCYRSAALPLLTLGADLITWLFIFDDTYGENNDFAEANDTFDLFEAYLADSVSAAVSPLLDPRKKALVGALLDLRERGRKLGGDAWVERFVNSIRHYFNGCLLELPYRLGNITPSLRNYRQLRLGSIGGLPVFDLIELEYHRHDVARLVSDARWRELRELACLLCAWTNDIYSFNKESTDGDPINLIEVLSRDSCVPHEEGQKLAAKVYADDLHAFQVLRKKFDDASGTTEVERECTQALENWIYGNVAWSRETKRYLSKDVSAPVSAWTEPSNA